MQKERKSNRADIVSNAWRLHTVEACTGPRGSRRYRFADSRQEGIFLFASAERIPIAHVVDRGESRAWKEGRFSKPFGSLWLGPQGWEARRGEHTARQTPAQGRWQVEQDQNIKRGPISVRVCANAVHEEPRHAPPGVAYGTEMRTIRASQCMLSKHSTTFAQVMSPSERRAPSTRC